MRFDSFGLGCYATAANTADVKAAPAVLVWVLDMYERIAKVLADKGYRGALAALIGQAFENRKVEVEISQRPEEVKGFQVEPKRWIVVVMLANQIQTQHPFNLLHTAWYHKSFPTFADALALVGQQLWQLRLFQLSKQETDTVNVPRAFFKFWSDLLCYAA